MIGKQRNILQILFMYLNLVNSSFNIDENSHQYSRNNLAELGPIIETAKALPDNLDSENSFYLDTNSLFFNNDTTTNVSSHCLHDLVSVFKNINASDDRKSWALQMLDSFGKLQSSIIKGNLKWLGAFDECRSVYAPKMDSSSGFHGQYCSLRIPLDSTRNPLEILTVELCFPDSCSSSDLNFVKKFIIISKNVQLLKEKDPIMNSTTISCKPNKRKLSNAAVATMCICLFFILLTVLGSCITILKYGSSFLKHRDCSNQDSVSEKDYNQKDTDDMLFIQNPKTKLRVLFDKVDPFLNCFCIFCNGSKLLNTDTTEGQMLCLHGIRFLSMAWVILCHTYESSFLVVRKMLEFINLTDNLAFQVILNGFYSVDAFFVLSAFLMSYLYLQNIAKKKRNISWVYFYFHRYIRLTPLYMLMMGFYTTLLPYLGSGPFWPDYDIEPLCQKNWWWNILYINNFLGSTEMCMKWSWYLANDMQFFIISPIFLIPLFRWPRIGCAILVLFAGASIVVSFLISYHYKLITGFGEIASVKIQINFAHQWANYFEKLYIKPYTRIGPYIVGIALGYIMFKRQLNHSKTNKIILCIGWILATAVGLTFVYSLYHDTPSVLAASFYNAWNHTIYAVCLSWVIFNCLSQQAGIVDKILSFKLFIPLSRLTYCAYLIHPMVITWYFSSMKTTLDFSHEEMVFLYLRMMLLTYALSLVISLVVESPIIRLEKNVRSQFNT